MTAWRDMLSAVMYSGGPCNAVLAYWLKVIDSTDLNTGSGLYILRRDYSPKSYTFFQILEICYNQIKSCLLANEATIRTHVPGLNIDGLTGGMVIDLAYRLVYLSHLAYGGEWAGYLVPGGTTGHVYTVISGTVGPYTIYINRCENRVIDRITEIQTNAHTTHQSVDAHIGLADETQRTLDATTALRDRIQSPLNADIALIGPVKAQLAAWEGLEDEVRALLSAREALRDTSLLDLSADGKLTAQHEFSFEAYERLLYDHHHPLDADICVLNRVGIALTADIILLPDDKDKIKVDLEKYFIQAGRINTKPIPYEVYNSEKDREVTP